MTLPEMRDCVKVYQEQLGLQSWNIKIKYLKKNAENDAGCIYWMTELAAAQILVAKDELDPEHTIVHELLHLLYEGHKFGPNKYDRAYERGLNRTAELIVGRPMKTIPGFDFEVPKRRCKRRP